MRAAAAPCVDLLGQSLDQVEIKRCPGVRRQLIAFKDITVRDR